MTQRNGKLQNLVRAGAVKRHRRSVVTASPKAGKARPFRTFRLKPGIRIEKAVKSVH